MRRAFAALLLSAAASVLPAQPSSIGLSQSWWLRSYPLEAYSGYWRLNLRVKDLDKAMKALTRQLEKAGAQPTLPLSHFASSQTHRVQQLSYRVPAKGAEKTFEALKKLGVVEQEMRSPAAGTDVVDEVRQKTAALKTDLEAGKEALARMPAVSALVSELMAHLANVEKAQIEAKGRILLNLELREESR